MDWCVFNNLRRSINVFVNKMKKIKIGDIIMIIGNKRYNGRDTKFIGLIGKIIGLKELNKFPIKYLSNSFGPIGYWQHDEVIKIGESKD